MTVSRVSIICVKFKFLPLPLPFLRPTVEEVHSVPRFLPLFVPVFHGLGGMSALGLFHMQLLGGLVPQLGQATPEPSPIAVHIDVLSHLQDSC